MQVINKSKHIIKRATLSGTALALILTPTAAFAHSSHDDNGSRGSGRQASSSQQQKQRNNDSNRNNSWRQKNHDRQKLTCQQRQDALNQRAADAKTKYTKKLTVTNFIYDGVRNYAQNSETPIPNYDAMNAQVAADQATATNAVNAITAPQLNCDDDNTAAAMSDDNKTWHDCDNRTNDSITAARQAMSTYRQDLNKLVDAVLES